MHSKYGLSNLLFIIAFPCFLYAQPCVNVSGQTAAFTLSAGAKASWNTSIAGVKQLSPKLKDEIFLSVYQRSANNIAIRTSNFINNIPLRISFYSLDGRKIGDIAQNGIIIGEFNKKLVAGVYFARLEAAGLCLNTTRFLVGK